MHSKGLDNKCSVVTQRNNSFFNKTRRKMSHPQQRGTILITMRLLTMVVLMVLTMRTVEAQEPFSSALTLDDDRCFLQPGGSVANFFINESHPVGTVIGSLKIGGDPRPGGDILLSLEDKGVPVQIAQHSKDLILMGRIDKEGKQGQAHISLDVICKRLGTSDPTMIIPVNIRVTDVNDNAPVFQNAPYFVNISEATVIGTIIFGDIHATDDDQKGSFSDVKYTIGPGVNSGTFEFESPIRGSLRLKEPLDYEKYPIFNVSIVAQDFGTPPQKSETTLTVLVSDSDDQNPAFTRYRYMATLPQPAIKGSSLQIQPEPIFASDQDIGIRARVVYSLGTDVPEAHFFGIDSHSGEVFLTEDIPASDIAQPISLSIFATQVDNPDRRAGTILTISRRGYRAKQLQFMRTLYNISVPENLPQDSLITETIINRNIDQSISFRLSDSKGGVFRVTQSGQVLLASSLDFEKKQTYHLDIMVTDGQYNDTAKLIVAVLNVNDWDPRFRFPQYEFIVVPDQLQKGAMLGRVEVADGDTGDNIELTLLGQDSRFFTVSPLGEILLVEDSPNITEAHVVVLARDSGDPPRQSSVPVTIKFPGSHASMAAQYHTTSWFLLVMIFGGLLAVFILIVICLAAYIHKNKKFRDDPAAALPTKLSALVPAAMGGGSGKVHPMGGGTQSRVTRLGTATTLLRPTLANGRARDNAGFNGSGTEEEENEESPPVSTKGKRRHPKNVVIPQLHSGGSTTSSATGDEGGSLNGTNSTASVGTPETTRMSATRCPDGTVRGSGGGLRTSPPNYLFPHSPAYPHSTFSPRQRSPSPPPFGGDVSTFSPPHVLRPPSAFSNGGVHNVNNVHSANNVHINAYDSNRCLWPQGTIPKKVKKLSWEDELYSQTELDPEVSVTPMPQNNLDVEYRDSNQSGLTVYF